MDLLISSNILRQSQYALASGFAANTFFAYSQSTSQRAIMFSVGLTFFRFELPIPPIPTTAILSLSLGAGVLRPKPLTTELGSIVKPAATAPVVPRNVRRVMCFEFSFIVRKIKIYN